MQHSCMMLGLHYLLVGCCVQLVTDYCRLDLTCPVPGCDQQEMRIMLLEGSLKLRDAYSKVTTLTL